MIRYRRLFLALIAAAFAVTLIPSTASAQYFGRNKVVWEDFDFEVLKTEHFDIYYYGEQEPVIEDVGRMAERWYERLSVAFDTELSERKPIVIYKNHPDFQQTTTTGGLIGEGTGGFTDAFRNRVVMPLAENYADTDHVLGHELVHVFQFDTSARLRRGAGTSRLQSLPLWMIEGLAEYLSQGHYDVQTSMWLRDAMLHDELPDLRKLSTDPRFSPYQYGQAFWAYVGGRWSDRAVTQLFYASQLYGIEGAIKRVLGVESKVLFDDWHAAIRQQWEPVMDQRVNPLAEGRVVLNEETTRSELNVAPSLSPDGRLVAFLSTRDLFGIDLYLADATTGRVIRRLVSASQTPHFDALRFIDSSGSWSPDGRTLAVSIIERGDNRLALVDTSDGDIRDRIKIEGIESFANPAWFPDGQTLVVSGMTSAGISDLYRVDIRTGQVSRLTDDRWGDVHPEVSPDGRTIAFVTERGSDPAALEYQKPRIALLDVATSAVRVLEIFPEARHINPQFSPDGGTIYFIADPDGVSDLFAYDITSGAIRRLTRVATGIAGITDMSPAVTVSGTGTVMVSIFNDDEWSIMTLLPEELVGTVATASDSQGGARSLAGTLPPGASAAGENFVTGYLQEPLSGLPPTTAEFTTTDYDANIGLDYIGAPGVGVSTSSFGTAVGGSIALGFGDVLGRHKIGVQIATSGQASENAFDQIGGELYYLNQSNRFQWGVTASHIPYRAYGGTSLTRGVPVEIDGDQVIADVYETPVLDTTFDEGALILQYPFGLTRRVEGSAGWLRYGYDAEVRREYVIGNRLIGVEELAIGDFPSLSLYRAGAAFVGDSSYFGFISPVSGTRYRVEGRAFSGDLSFYDALADYRRYFFVRPVTFAFRGMHFGRYGDDAENDRLSDLFVGRSHLVRGYEAGDFSAAECTPTAASTCPQFERLVGSKIAVANFEVRFPLFGSEDYGLFNLPYFATELAAFADAGVAWTEDEDPVWEYDVDSIERVPVVSVGVAARILLGGYLPLNFYYAKPLHRPEADEEFGFLIAAGW